jgi:hypothetical protein
VYGDTIQIVVVVVVFVSAGILHGFMTLRTVPAVGGRNM